MCECKYVCECERESECKVEQSRRDNEPNDARGSSRIGRTQRLTTPVVGLVARRAEPLRPRVPSSYTMNR